MSTTYNKSSNEQNVKSYIYLNDYVFDRPILDVWKKISDTNRLHEVSGAGAYVSEEVIMSDKSIVRHCHGFLGKGEIGNVNFVWTERFGEWKAPFYLRQQRYFSSPVKFQIKLEFFLEEINENKCKLHSELTFLIHSRLAGILGFLNIFKKMSDNRWKGLINFVNEKKDIPNQTSTWKYPDYTQEQKQQVHALTEQINAKIFSHHLGEKIANYIMKAFAIDASRIRPIELAHKWNLPEQNVIEGFLQAMTLGLVDMRWDVICPQCRIMKAQSGGLHDIPAGLHCSSCNIDFSRDYNENVEMTFQPAQWLRNIENPNFCMLSAQLTPHIIIQLRVPPGRQEITEFTLKPGEYRVRILEDQLHEKFTISASETGFVQIVLKENSLEVITTRKKNIKFRNDTKWHRFFIIEDLSYKNNALTVSKTLTLHAFRQLCPEQLIKPGDNIGISNVIIMFTDLKDSTAFYEHVGETKAYHIVREHFSFLSEIIYKNKGAIVKTIGDAVMAVFNEPKNAFMTAVEIEKQLATFNQKNECNIAIKISLNQNNCIAVNLNSIMDYFGTAVNIAARLLDFSDSQKFVISKTLKEDFNIVKLIKELKLKYTKQQKLVKGIKQPVYFYEIYYNNRKQIRSSKREK